MISAGMVTHTSIVDFMSMKMLRFYRMYAAIGRVLERRKEG